MATIHKEIEIERNKEFVWDAIRDVGAIHKRLVPGFVVDCKLDGDWRTVKFGNGMIVRELIVAVDDKTCRHSWSARGKPLTHHNASVQVFSEGQDKCRVVWIADLMPNAVAEAIDEMIQQALNTMKQTLESSATKGENPLRTLQAARHISISINRPPLDVYNFVSKPENLPKWATGLGQSITNVNGEWIAESPMGKVKVRFAEKNTFGILDHDVVLESGAKIHNPMRVVPNGSGSEIVFTLLRQPDMSDEKVSQDAKWVEEDLTTLKAVLEK